MNSAKVQFVVNYTPNHIIHSSQLVKDIDSTKLFVHEITVSNWDLHTQAIQFFFFLFFF